ncbi:type II toxin-antitoxin system HipA family toxin [Cryobacterium fucosi]|uniref:Type II toxin-antitoxin system HipA family toxin n=1 Tax=Cryobacterium fucosi TaxID=1259157 RepID=A0A4R9BAN7_9MICO|nr:HipA domain-containing protein [Cryobacterium fucosi]TFD79203.1 type II toxin-antitoxin system HipA family toxin [Cryobacterium fucosi]
MATSDFAFVWAWLPNATEPVVAGRLRKDGTTHSFRYGDSYLARTDKVALYLPELPLVPLTQRPDPTCEAPGCILDAAPDYWGRRVILAKHFGRLDADSDTDDLDLLNYLLESGSDRIGALDFQESATTYVPRQFEHQATLTDLLAAADRIQAGETLSPVLEAAMMRGTSIGGARPKALIEDGPRKLIAKFSSTTDTYPVVKAEGIAMHLALKAGLDVAPAAVVRVGNRDVLLVERFDRGEGGTRKMMVSALTMLGLAPMNGRYATYPELADLIRARFTNPNATLRELFGRIVFNVIVGNIDDHARNHAAFWDGSMLALTPAYDICPQPRSVGEVEQALAIGRTGDRRSRLQVCENSADVYHLTGVEARDIIDHLVSVVEDGWEHAADLVELDVADRLRLKGGAILNQSIFYRD